MSHIDVMPGSNGGGIQKHRLGQGGHGVRKMRMGEGGHGVRHLIGSDPRTWSPTNKGDHGMKKRAPHSATKETWKGNFPKHTYHYF